MHPLPKEVKERGCGKKKKNKTEKERSIKLEQIDSEEEQDDVPKGLSGIFSKREKRRSKRATSDNGLSTILPLEKI